MYKTVPGRRPYNYAVKRKIRVARNKREIGTMTVNRYLDATIGVCFELCLHPELIGYGDWIKQAGLRSSGELVQHQAEHQHSDEDAETRE